MNDFPGPAVPAQFSMAALCLEAECELLRRRRDYPAKVARGRMKADHAIRKVQLMAAIVMVLRQFKRSELLL